MKYRLLLTIQTAMVLFGKKFLVGAPTNVVQIMYGEKKENVLNNPRTIANANERPQDTFVIYNLTVADD